MRPRESLRGAWVQRRAAGREGEALNPDVVLDPPLAQGARHPLRVGHVRLQQLLPSISTVLRAPAVEVEHALRAAFERMRRRPEAVAWVHREALAGIVKLQPGLVDEQVDARGRGLPSLKARLCLPPEQVHAGQHEEAAVRPCEASLRAVAGDPAGAQPLRAHEGPGPLAEVPVEVRGQGVGHHLAGGDGPRQAGLDALRLLPGVLPAAVLRLRAAPAHRADAALDLRGRHRDGDRRGTAAQLLHASENGNRSGLHGGAADLHAEGLVPQQHRGPQLCQAPRELCPRLGHGLLVGQTSAFPVEGLEGGA
mmetsp:Transcript_63834/g.172262  ORF Transcript_63834/g.172262 Transcript_63834/m.172262 type:complete len:309 (-) Transcript_63834:92-1018(-)